jgi:multiple sugar transport system permease protein
VAVVPDVAFALAWLWILNPLYGPLDLTLAAIGNRRAELAG